MPWQDRIREIMLSPDDPENILGPIAQKFFLERLLKNLGWLTTGKLSDLTERGPVSFYDNSSVDPRWGGRMKSGGMFDEDKISAAVLPALWDKYKGKTMRFYNMKTGRFVDAPVTDTGGFGKQEHDFRIADLSKKAMSVLAGGRPHTLEDVMMSVLK